MRLRPAAGSQLTARVFDIVILSPPSDLVCAALQPFNVMRNPCIGCSLPDERVCPRSAYLTVVSTPVAGDSFTEIIITTLSKSTGKKVRSFTKKFTSIPEGLAIVP